MVWGEKGTTRSIDWKKNEQADFCVFCVFCVVVKDDVQVLLVAFFWNADESTWMSKTKVHDTCQCQ